MDILSRDLSLLLGFGAGGTVTVCGDDFGSVIDRTGAHANSLRHHQRVLIAPKPISLPHLFLLHLSHSTRSPPLHPPTSPTLLPAHSCSHLTTTPTPVPASSRNLDETSTARRTVDSLPSPHLTFPPKLHLCSSYCPPSRSHCPTWLRPLPMARLPTGTRMCMTIQRSRTLSVSETGARSPSRTPCTDFMGQTRSGRIRRGLWSSARRMESNEPPLMVLSFSPIAMPITILHTPLPSAGANSVDIATPSRVSDFVKAHGGHTVITKVSPRTLALPPRPNPRPAHPSSRLPPLTPIGPHRQQRYRRRQGDPVHPEMVLRDFWL